MFYFIVVFAWLINDVKVTIRLHCSYMFVYFDIETNEKINRSNFIFLIYWWQNLIFSSNCFHYLQIFCRKYQFEIECQIQINCNIFQQWPIGNTNSTCFLTFDMNFTHTFTIKIRLSIRSSMPITWMISEMLSKLFSFLMIRI